MRSPKYWYYFDFSHSLALMANPIRVHLSYQCKLSPMAQPICRPALLQLARRSHLNLAIFSSTGYMLICVWFLTFLTKPFDNFPLSRLTTEWRGTWIVLRSWQDVARQSGMVRTLVIFLKKAKNPNVPHCSLLFSPPHHYQMETFCFCKSPANYCVCPETHLHFYLGMHFVLGPVEKDMGLSAPLLHH